MSKLLSTLSDVGSGLKQAAGGALNLVGSVASTPGSLVQDLGSVVSGRTSKKKVAASQSASKSSAAKEKVLSKAAETKPSDKLYTARETEKFANDIKHLRDEDAEINMTISNVMEELDNDNIAAEDASRAANVAASMLASTLDKMGATSVANDIRTLQSGGVTASEFNRILGNSLRYALASTQTALTDVASAHGKISALKDVTAALGISIDKLKNTSVISIGRINSLLQGRGLMPSGKMMEDLNAGAVFFGENGIRRLDIVTFIMNLVALKSVRLYAQEDSATSSGLQLFSKGEELRIITGFRIAQVGTPILANDTFILGRENQIAQGDVSTLRETMKVYDANYLIATTTLPTLAPNVGTLAKIAASGFVSGSIDNVFGQFVGLFTESISNFLSGARDSDFHRGM